MKCNPILTQEKIKDVREEKNGYSITQEDGWSIYIDKKYNVKPKKGDTIWIRLTQKFGQIMGIKINNKTLFSHTKEYLTVQHIQWQVRTRIKYKKEYEELMEEIKDNPSFKTIDISGMGGGYENACQNMLKAGIEFLKTHPEFHFDYQQYKNVYGICITDTPWGKDLDKALLKAVNNDCTGAMHQAVINHLNYIFHHSYEEWLKQNTKKRQYIYPQELPISSMCKED